MNESEEYRIRVSGGVLAGRFWPGRGRPVLALHGWLDNACSFAPLAEYIANPLFAMDFPGHGYSSQRPEQTMLHFVDYVRDVHQLLRELDWQAPILLGHSMGAGVAALYAGTFPDCPSALVLLEGLGPLTAAGERAPENLRKAIEGMTLLQDKRKPVYADREQAVRARMGGFGGLGRVASEILCERGLEAVEEGWTWRTDSRLRVSSPLRMTNEQVAAFLRAIRVPALLVGAEQGMAGQGAFDAGVALVPELETVRLEGTHHLHMECPERVAEPLCRFIERL